MKKILSIFLAILMAFSCLTVSFAAQAQPDLSQYTPSKVNFHLFPKKSADKLADRCTAVLSALIDVASQLDPDFKKVDDIVSNKTFKYIFMAFFEDMTPAECAAVLPQDSFAGAKEVLSAAQSWDEVTFKSGDFDFADGDLDGFLDSEAVVMYVWEITYDKEVFTSLDPRSEEVRIAYKEMIEPFFDFLGMKAVPWEEVEKRAEEQENGSIVMIRAIGEPIYKATLDFLKNPGDKLWDFIVRVCYILDTDMINTMINTTKENISEKQEPVFASEEDGQDLLSMLNSSGLYNFVTEKGIPLFDGLSEEQVVQAIHNIAGCGTVVKNPDKPGNFIIKADKGKTVVCIFNTILDWQKTKEFVKAVVEPMYPNRPVARTFMVVYMMLYARLMPRALVYGEFSLLLSILAKTISKAVV